MNNTILKEFFGTPNENELQNKTVDEYYQEELSYMMWNEECFDMSDDSLLIENLREL